MSKSQEQEHPSFCGRASCEKEEEEANRWIDGEQKTALAGLRANHSGNCEWQAAEA